MSEKDRNMASEQEVKQWLLSISKGDQETFTRLLRLYWNKVYTQALTYLKSTVVAEEITQDVFLKVWSIREKLTEVDDFSSYLFILSRNEVISRLRKRKMDISEFPITLEELILQPDRQLQFKELHQKMMILIEQLPPVRKKVFKMSRLDGKSYEEIGTELGISRNGVKDHVVKALNYLRSHFRVGHVLVVLYFVLLAFQKIL